MIKLTSLSTIRTDTYTVMYNHLQTGTYAITTNNIHPSYNDTHLAKEGYPQVVIWEPMISESILTKGAFTNSVKQANITYWIHIRHNSAANLRLVVDEICNKIRTGLSVFRAENLRPQRDEFISENYGQTYARPNQTIHYCDLSVKFKYLGSS